MKNIRFNYFCIIISVIIIGILSRKINGIPLFLGDILYGMMIYFMIKLILINTKIATVALISLNTCFAIEFLQLYQANWIVEIRNTTIGHYILGQGFLWTDLLCLAIGVGLGFIINLVLVKNNRLKKSI
jgi:Protein of unknown function (DUF2809)